MKKKIRTGLLLFFGLLAINLLTPAGMLPGAGTQTVSAKTSEKKGLHKDTKTGNYYYIGSDGKKLLSEWKTIGKYRYYFKKNGYAATGGLKIGDKVYLFDADGHLKTSKKTAIIKVKNSYYFMEDGEVKTGLFCSEKKWYYANPSNGKLAYKTWKTIDGNRYYFKKNCAAATGGTRINETLYVFTSRGKLIKKSPSAMVKVGKYYYYVDKNGKGSTGWFTVGKKTCHADSKGHMTVGTTYDGVTFDSNGYAKAGEALTRKKKIVKYYNSIVNSSMSMSRKLRACWNYVCSGRIHYSSAYYPNIYSSNWVEKCALHTLETGSGNCYGYACAFAVLAREAGYSVDVIAGRVSGSRDGASDGLTRHCWVRINGAYYDPEAQYEGWWRRVYGLGSYSITHQVVKVVHLS